MSSSNNKSKISKKRRVPNEKSHINKKMKTDNVLDNLKKDLSEIDNFVNIPQMEKNIKHFQLCIENKLCIFLNGPVGSGKSTFVDYMAKQMNKTVCKVQMSDDTDYKTLLGGYCCTDVPNEYKWVDGPLIRAMKNGCWLVLEDVLTGQSDIFGMLRSLFEAKTHGLRPKLTNIIQLNEEIIASEDFRIIVTQSLSEIEDGYREVSLKTENCRYSSNCLNKCQTILIDKLSNASLEIIIKSNYPSITSFLPKLTCTQGILDLVMKFNELKGLSRVNSSRDLFKFCHRISNINLSTEDQAVCYFLDALDCFVHHLSDNEFKRKFVTILGSVFNLNKVKVENTMQHRSCKISSDPVRENILYVGRVELMKKERGAKDSINPSRHMAQTRQMVQLLETLSRCVQMKEPVLLVSETGCGKTSTVQYLSKLLYRKLIVINMNQESDSADWLGGYKPVNNAMSEEQKSILNNRFNDLMNCFNKAFQLSFNGEKNAVFLNYVKKAYESKNYDVFLKLIGSKVISDAVHGLEKLTLSESLKKDWSDIYENVDLLSKELKKLQSSYTFSFIEGALVKAMKNGDWILLDEINLAPPEILQSLSGLLESSKGSITLTERGDKIPIERHEDFRMFACMNPCNDVGKKNLPQGLRNRFTEIYLHELDDVEELSVIVKYYLGSLSYRLAESVVSFYLDLRMNVKNNRIVDGADNKPQFSLRTLCRGLEAVGHIITSELYKTTTIRALYEGFSFSFKSQLKDESRQIFDDLFRQHFKIDLTKFEVSGLLSNASVAEQLIRKDYKIIMGYAIKTGSIYQTNIEEIDEFVKGYKITKSVSRNLKDLARIVSSGKSLPVLVQGETSVGKTSLITYLAKLTGNICHRVNNHESTDVQEYVGSYVNESSSGSKRKFVFKEGILVHAMRQGHWIILDELNLAPTEVLEALNRVLDDNRELFIPETQTTIKAHPMFRLFATQNPPGMYGGRNVLSRALRNRFIELHFNPIPDVELVEILDECCKIPKNKGRKMVETMRLMHIKTQELDLAQGNQKYISLRDLFRWARRVYQQHDKADRFFDWERCMVEEGYLLLTGKERSIEGVKVVTDTLAEIFKNSQVQLNDEWFFSASGSNIAKSILEKCSMIQGMESIEWTFDLCRLAVLLIRSLQCNEPVLLVGNTGCGKTTVCQLAAMVRNCELLSINCHQYTDASDFLGAMRPVDNDKKSDRLFEWIDGPLVVAMKEGKMFLIDEISLADHSVLERLNSVLESDRKLTLVENSASDTEQSVQKTNQSSYEIVASPEFQVVATMNPGGDSGKKELSPALRNRFTEIWCPSNSWNTTESGFNDWVKIAERNLSLDEQIEIPEIKIKLAKVVVNFLRYVHEISYEIKFSVVTIRDLLAWIQFINVSQTNKVSIYESLMHGAYMVIIDSISNKVEKKLYEMRLIEKIKYFVNQYIPEVDNKFDLSSIDKKLNIQSSGHIGISPFYISMGPYTDSSLIGNFSNGDKDNQKYSFTNKTTIDNLYRLFRAMQIGKKPLLLEGSPGVGKTSLVSQLAKIAGFKVVRINLSEQTEASDLFGCVLPTENENGLEFSWKDGPFLQALRNGDWILLDEMNLASSEVLESLNACFDHRGEIYIPEINQTFHLKRGQTRFFACQNPQSEGSGRNSLPKSFINRFNQVYMASLETSDYVDILSNIYCQIPEKTIRFMVDYVQRLQYEVMVLRSFGLRGSPWEFNLRDLTRWCDLLIAHKQDHKNAYFEPSIFASLLFVTRFRTQDDQEAAINLYNGLAEEYRFSKLWLKHPELYVTSEFVKVGRAKLKINNDTNNCHKNSEFIERSFVLPGQLWTLESIMLTIEMGWLTILAGGSGTGKTSIINLLAEITRNNLRTMSMNSSMETCDLLGSFEQIKGGRQIKWIDSTLVQSLKNGDWLVLDTVNFCKPSVLDRLNGLLEPNGSLILNERGPIKGGQLEEIKPHPNFRMFLIMDPECEEEISRAMRNRGLEIAMVASHKEQPLNDEDILSLLTNSHKIGEEQALQVLHFHKTVIKCQENFPQIKIGNVSSLMQVCRLLNQGYALNDCLEIVYKDMQLTFNVRNEINEIIASNSNNIFENKGKECLDNEIFCGTLSLCNLISNPKTEMVRQHFTAAKNCIKLLSMDSENRIIVARLFMQYSSLNDICDRLSLMENFDSDYSSLCNRFSDILRRSQINCNDSSLPIDLRWLPNWAEFLSLDFRQANSILFHMYNIENSMDHREYFAIDENVKPSFLTENTIGTFNVFQIAKLLGLGRLSKAIISRLVGFDKSILDFIHLLSTFSFGELCNMDNMFLLIRVSKLLHQFCQFVPSKDNNWISAFSFHITSILETLSIANVKYGEIKKVGQKILSNLNEKHLNPDENMEIVRDIFRSIGVKRNLVRLTYSHSNLIDCYDYYRSLISSEQLEKKSITIWNAMGEESLKSSLCTLFCNYAMETKPVYTSSNDLLSQFDIETVRIWPFMLTMLAEVINSSSKPLVNVLEFGSFIPPLPCDFQKRLTDSDQMNINFISLSDWTSYLISQGAWNQIVANCNFHINTEADEQTIELDFSNPKFKQPSIKDTWTDPNKSIFLLVNGSRCEKDIYGYLSNIGSVNSANRCLRSISTRKNQLKICKINYMESVCVITSKKLRIERERKLLTTLIRSQRNCIVSCWNEEGNVDEWINAHFPWFFCLESDINNLEKMVHDKKDDRLVTMEIGKLWIRWGCVQMKLFIVTETLDPQCQLYWENKYLSEEIEDLSTQENIASMYRRFFIGINKYSDNHSEQCWNAHGLEHPLLHATWKRLKELREVFQKQVSSVLRPVPDGKFHELRNRIIRFMSRYGWTLLCDDSDSTMRNVSDLDSSFIIEWSMGAGELLEYFLSSTDRFAFPDLIEPLALAIGRVLVGMDLIQRTKSILNNDFDERTKSATKMCELFCQFPNCNNIDLVERILKEEYDIMKHCSILIGESKAEIMAKVHMKLLHLSLRLLNLPNKDLKRTVDLLHKLIDIFNTLWNKQEKKRREKEEAEASSYMKKQSITENLNEEELETLNIYLEVCPATSGLNGDGYFDHKSMEMSTTMNSAILKIQNLREQLQTLERALILSEDTVHSIVTLIENIFNGSKMLSPDQQEQESQHVYRDCYQFAAALICSDSGNVVIEDKLCLFPSHISALSWEYESLNSSSKEQTIDYAKPYDIYQDPVKIGNIITTQSILEGTKKSVKKLLNDYPDNVTLMRIEKKIDGILMLSLDCPLISFKTSVERLMHEIQQWEIVAARHVSLLVHVDELNRLLSLWSHEELKMWQNTLVMASWKLKRSVSVDFFQIYNNILIEIEKIDSQCENDRDEINDFQHSINTIFEPIMFMVTNSIVGNFKPRLSVIKLIIDYVSSMCSRKEMKRSNRFLEKLKFILKNHLDYYRLYERNVDDHLSLEHKKIEQELKNFIKTKKWGDAPPKSTDLAKCHKIVFKYLRQWNEVINKSVSTFMILNPINALKCVSMNKLNIFQPSFTWLWCKEMTGFCEEMWDAMTKFRKETTDLETKAVEDVKASSDDEKMMESLKKTWIVKVKNLQQRKRNFVTSFVKQLKEEIGLTSFFGRFPRHTALMTHLPSGDVELNVLSANSDQLSAIRCIGLRLQLDESDKSEEFAKFNMFKDHLIGICDHLLSISCSSTIRINRWKKDLEIVQMMTESITKTMQSEIQFSIDPVCIEKEIKSMNNDYQDKLCQWSRFIILCSESVTKGPSSENIPSLINDDNLKPKLLLGISFSSSCAKIVEMINTIKEEIRKNEVPQGFLVTQDHVDCLNRQKSIVKSLDSLVEEIKIQFSPDWIDINSSITCEFQELNRRNWTIIEELESRMLKSLPRTNLQNEPSSLTEFKKMIDNVKLSVNESLTKFSDLYLKNKVCNDDQDIDLSIVKMIDEVDKMEMCIGIDKIGNQLQTIIDGFKAIHNLSSLEELRRNINEEFLPNLNRLMNLNQEFSILLINIHNVLLGATDALITVTSKLMTEGFCKPNESIWEKNSDEGQGSQNEKINDFEMAGMDSGGTGMNDVSDQIESESQIEGTNKDQKNDENQDKDVEDEENGIEMTEDFEAKLHDNKEDKEKNKNDDDNDKEDEMKDLEDKMGEVGESPETDVNKDSWDKENPEKEEDNKNNDEEKKKMNEDKRNGGVSSKENEVETVADDEEKCGNDEEEKSKEKEEPILPNENANEWGEQEGEMENNDVQDEEKENEMDAIDQFWDDDGCLDENEENGELDNKINQDEAGMDNENNEEDEKDVEGDGETNEDPVELEDNRMKDENPEDNTESNDNDLTVQEQNIVGRNDCSNEKEMTYDIQMDAEEMSGENDDNGVNGNGNGCDNFKNMENSESGRIDQQESKHSDEIPPMEKNEKEMSKPSENRKLGNVDEKFKRKADVVDMKEKENDCKRQKLADSYAHIDKNDNADEDDGRDEEDQVIDDATANQEQRIPEIDYDGEDDDDQLNKAKQDQREEDDYNEDKTCVKTEENKKTDPKQSNNDDDAKKDGCDSVVVAENLETVAEKLTWLKVVSRIQYLIGDLCENLRTVLNPTKANVLGGAFSSGKRINMKRLVHILASGDDSKNNFWMRRIRPRQREYQVIIAVDNSKSMSYNVSDQTFFESLAIVLEGLKMLKVGQVGVCKFGDRAEEVVPLYETFSTEIGEELIDKFDFTDRSSKFVPMLEQTLKLFEENRCRNSSSTSQFLIILSDGNLSEDVSDPKLVGLIREAHHRGIMVVVVILDHPDQKESITNLKMVVDDGTDFVRFLDHFPFQHFIVLQNVVKLPVLLSDALRQWFALSSGGDRYSTR